MGLPLTSYFSGPKMKWMLDNVTGLREAAEKGELYLGNIDAWLIWLLTGEFKTDVTNASRTMMMNLETLDWDSDMMAVFGVERSMLPRICSSSEVYGLTYPDGVFEMGIPVAGDLGDQQAALFGQACFGVGEAQEHVRHRLFHAQKHRGAPGSVQERSFDHFGIQDRG